MQRIVMYLKKALFFSFLAFVGIYFLLPSVVWAELHVHSAILADMGTGKILYEQNADEVIPPASLTKILTMYMALEKVQEGSVSMKSPVLVSRAAAKTQGSRMELRARESVALEKLLLGMAVSSGNDASLAVAEFLGGTQDNFVRQMNAKAAQLGMKSSVFYNPHGLPAPHQATTARDMLLLSFHYLQKFPEALPLHATKYMRHNGMVTYNKNPLLGNVEGADGLKTGWVNASGYNLIATVRRGDTRLVAVIMGADSSKMRAQEVYKLMEAGFVAMKQGETVAEVLPSMFLPPLKLDKTVQEAYATLAPEVLAYPKKRVRQSSSKNVRKTLTATGNKQTAKEKTKKTRKATREDVRQASLPHKGRS